MVDFPYSLLSPPDGRASFTGCHPRHAIQLQRCATSPTSSVLPLYYVAFRHCQAPIGDFWLFIFQPDTPPQAIYYPMSGLKAVTGATVPLTHFLPWFAISALTFGFGISGQVVGDFLSLLRCPRLIIVGYHSRPSAGERGFLDPEFSLGTTRVQLKVELPASD